MCIFTNWTKKQRRYVLAGNGEGRENIETPSTENCQHRKND
jgi:hypothetical protein